MGRKEKSMRTCLNNFRKMPGGYSPAIVIPGTAADFPVQPENSNLDPRICAMTV